MKTRPSWSHRSVAAPSMGGGASCGVPSTIGYDEEGANATEKLRNLTQSSVVTKVKTKENIEKNGVSHGYLLTTSIPSS